MKAMLRCDLLNFKQSAKSVLFLVILFCGMAVFSQNTMFFGILLTTLCLTVPFHLFGYDAAYGWDKLVLSLPISRTNVIISKYILFAGLLAVLLVLSVGSVGLYRLKNPEDTFATQMAAILLCAMTALFLVSIMIPFIIKFGVTKGRYILLAVVWVPIMLTVFFKDAIPANTIVFIENYVTNRNLLPLSLELLTIAFLFFFISSLISIAIYKQKEF